MVRFISTPRDLIMAGYRSKRKYWRGAAKHYAALLKAHPNNTNFRNKLLKSLFLSKQFERTISEIDTFGDNATLSTEILELKAKSLIKLSRYRDAITTCKKARDAGNDTVSTRLLEASAHLYLEDYKKAKVAYEEIITKAESQTPTDSSALVVAYHAIGYVYELEEDASKSRKHYETALSFSNDIATKELGIGILHEKRGWYQAALAAYKALLDKNPIPAELYFRIGKMCSKLVRTSEAAEAYKKFVEHDEQLNIEGHKLHNNMVVFDAYMGRNYACSPRAIFETMLRDSRYRKFTFIWVFRASSIRRHWRLYLNPRVKVVTYKSRDYFRAYARAKYWVTNSRLAFVQKTNPEQVYLQCWHGTPLKRLGHSIVENSKGSKHNKNSVMDLYDQDTQKLDYFVSPSKTASKLFDEAFLLNKFGKKILETGYPRNDFLKNVTPTQINAIKKRFSIPANKKVLLYAPTWRDDQHDAERGYTYKLGADFDYLQKTLSEEWVILFRAHYFVANTFNFTKYNGFVYDVSDVDDINDLYVISDVLMTDYSSVFFDYANLKRPIIFFMYDKEHYEKDLRGFYIDLNELPGDIVKEESEVVGILNNLKNYQAKRAATYEAFNETFNKLDDGNAAQRVIDEVIT